jgi:hypothetical protein
LPGFSPFSRYTQSPSCAASYVPVKLDKVKPII